MRLDDAPERAPLLPALRWRSLIALGALLLKTPEQHGLSVEKNLGAVSVSGMDASP